MPCPVMLDVGNPGHYASVDHSRRRVGRASIRRSRRCRARFRRLSYNQKMTPPSSSFVTPASFFLAAHPEGIVSERAGAPYVSGEGVEWQSVLETASRLRDL